MKTDTSKDNIFVTLYKDDLKKLLDSEPVYTGLFIENREIIIDFVACESCQEDFENRKKA